MRILLENGSYHLRNLGDVAMLQVAVRRLRELWPGARIHVLTDAPDLLATYCPGVQPLLSRGRTMFFENQDLFNWTHAWLPWGDGESSLDVKEAIRKPLPTERFRIRRRLRRRGINSHDVAGFLRTVSEADFIIVDGGGYITDLFEAHATHVLSLLGLAVQLGKPTAMFGQGLGPIRSPDLLAKTRSVLPSVKLIALREGRVGPGMLASLGVPADRVAITGDDAIDLAYEARASELGTGIGVNLRVSAYSEVENLHIEMIRTTLQDAANRCDAPLVPLPISSLEVESDVRTLKQLLGPRSAVGGPQSAVVCQRSAVGSRPQVNSDGGVKLDTPHWITQQISQCRIVVTGSYHGGIFALGQGIPVVGLAKSAYYVDKFLGLADQFGDGCQVMLLNDTQLPERLAAAIDGAWMSAGELRPLLLETARRQVEANRSAYRRALEMVTSSEVVA